jgi:hypothetical protein
LKPGRNTPVIRADALFPSRGGALTGNIQVNILFLYHFLNNMTTVSAGSPGAAALANKSNLIMLIYA